MPKLEPEQVYQLLRHLTSPVVAITCQRDGKRNGMISDSAVRASIAPTVPRLSVYIHKFNFSHDTWCSRPVASCCICYATISSS